LQEYDSGDARGAQSVSLERFETERTLELVPPDGEFAVMNYRSTHPFKPPFRVTCSVEEDAHLAFKARAWRRAERAGARARRAPGGAMALWALQRGGPLRGPARRARAHARLGSGSARSPDGGLVAGLHLGVSAQAGAVQPSRHPASMPGPGGACVRGAPQAASKLSSVCGVCLWIPCAGVEHKVNRRGWSPVRRSPSMAPAGGGLPGCADRVG
jgi:hypothetical protein